MEDLENKYYEWIISKTYFDCYCHEFKSEKVENKLLNMALYLKEGGDLHYAINSYKTDRSEYTLSSLMTTLIYYNDYIRTGERNGDFSIFLDIYLSEYQLISLLAAELKARLDFDYENNDDFSIMKKVYKVNIGGYKLEKYMNNKDLSKKDGLISIFKGELPSDFDLGFIDENKTD